MESELPQANVPPRQTLSYLHRLFAARRIRPKNKLGQNFLIDLNILDLLVRTAELGPDDVALEIGCGTGSLTTRLAEHATAVLGVEIDPAFHVLACELTAALPQVHILHADVLHGKNHLNPNVLAELQQLLLKYPEHRLKLVANLPYAVATPVLANLLLTELPVERMVVTVQWEIAARLLAQPDEADFGALSILVQSLAEVTLVRRLAPSVFFPRPQVESGIVCIRPDAGKRARIADVAHWRIFLRDLYSHRRKNLRGGLVSFPGDVNSKEVVDARLARLGIDGMARAETLSIDQHLQLFEAFRAP